MPDVVSGTFPLTFSTLVVAGEVAVSLEVLVLPLLLHANKELATIPNMNNFFM